MLLADFVRSPSPLSVAFLGIVAPLTRPSIDRFEQR